jgi:hypothetical protein
MRFDSHQLINVERERCAYILQALKDAFQFQAAHNQIEKWPELLNMARWIDRELSAAKRKIESGEAPNPYWMPSSDNAQSTESTQSTHNHECSHEQGCGVPAQCTAQCTWPGCTNNALRQSGNFGNQLVCSKHFKVTNGTKTE